MFVKKKSPKNKQAAKLKEMRKAAADLRFEEAAQYRDEIIEMRKALIEISEK